jgi:pimeloyl-ACP methyl ester carboxylesterase
VILSQIHEPVLYAASLQVELSRLSSNSRLLVAERSGHGIQIDQPDIVVDAIRQIVEAVRAGIHSNHGAG